MGGPFQPRARADRSGPRACKTCGVVKPEDEFHWKNKRTGLRRLDCKTCRSADPAKAEWQRAWNRTHLASIQEAKNLRRAANIALVNDLKSLPCSDCGQSYRPYVMDFDHVRGVKECNIARMARYPVSERRLLAEIAKCELVCANCHRERTFGQVA